VVAVACLVPPGPGRGRAVRVPRRGAAGVRPYLAGTDRQRAVRPHDQHQEHQADRAGVRQPHDGSGEVPRPGGTTGAVRAVTGRGRGRTRRCGGRRDPRRVGRRSDRAANDLPPPPGPRAGGRSPRAAGVLGRLLCRGRRLLRARPRVQRGSSDRSSSWPSTGSATRLAKEMLYVGLSRARTQLVVVGDLEQVRTVGGDGVAKRLSAAEQWVF